jgi:hypothetical protein
MLHYAYLFIYWEVIWARRFFIEMLTQSQLSAPITLHYVIFFPPKVTRENTRHHSLLTLAELKKRSYIDSLWY